MNQTDEDIKSFMTLSGYTNYDSFVHQIEQKRYVFNFSGMYLFVPDWVINLGVEQIKENKK